MKNRPPYIPRAGGEKKKKKKGKRRVRPKCFSRKTKRKGEEKERKRTGNLLFQRFLEERRGKNPVLLAKNKERRRLEILFRKRGEKKGGNVH